MQGLTIILLSDDRARNDGAIMMALAHAALHDETEARTRIFFHAPAVKRLTAINDPLLEEAQAMGVALVACQSGIAEHELVASTLGFGATVAGPIAIFANLGDDRLIMV
jgi:intracellular sulfur oxidation DsrE/DsrF family protein